MGYFRELMTVFIQFRAQVRLCFLSLQLWSESWLSLHPPPWLLVESFCSCKRKFPRLPLLCVTNMFSNELMNYRPYSTPTQESFRWSYFLSNSQFSFVKHSASLLVLMTHFLSGSLPLPLGHLPGPPAQSLTFSSDTVSGMQFTQDTLRKCMELDEWPVVVEQLTCISGILIPSLRLPGDVGVSALGVLFVCLFAQEHAVCLFTDILDIGQFLYCFRVINSKAYFHFSGRKLKHFIKYNKDYKMHSNFKTTVVFFLI